MNNNSKNFRPVVLLLKSRKLVCITDVSLKVWPFYCNRVHWILDENLFFTTRGLKVEICTGRKILRLRY